MPASPPLRSLWKTIRGRLRPAYRHAAHFEGVLGTTLELQLVADRPPQALQAQQALLDEIDRLELVFSRFLPESELNRWLAGGTEGELGRPTAVSADLGTVLQQALVWMTLSGGAFHPATEALSPLWKQAETSGTLPDLQPVLDRMRRPLYEVSGGPDGWTATRLSPLPLGFNAFAKGYIADLAAAAAFRVPGIVQVLVNIGGDLRCVGPQRVQVGVADPFTLADNAPAVGSVWVQGQGVATSGRARRGFQVGGQWHSHVLDPRSGRPAGQVVSSSVVAPDSARADVLATVFGVMTPAESLQLADQLPGVACLLIGADGRVHHNAAWTRLQASPFPSLLSPSTCPVPERPTVPEVLHDHATK